MTALQALHSALSMSDDPPSDEFEFESEYVKSLLRQRTPSPVIVKQSSVSQSYRGKENLDRWKTPVTIGGSAGRTILGQRDVNSSFNRSASVLGITGENNNHETPAIKLSSSYIPSALKMLNI